MQNDQGLLGKSPSYISEKTHLLGLGLNAFAYLDIYNMRKVVNWLEFWKVEVPEVVAEEMRRQENAAHELAIKGYL